MTFFPFHLVLQLQKNCSLFRFEPESGLITLTLANGAELNYQRAKSQFSPDIVTSELIRYFQMKL